MYLNIYNLNAKTENAIRLTLTYNFKTIDVEKLSLENISEDNPLKLVFKMAKSLLETKQEDEVDALRKTESH